MTSPSGTKRRPGSVGVRVNRKGEEMKSEMTVRAKAFTGYGAEWVRVMVEDDGSVLVYDDIAGYFTRCHSLSPAAERRIRRRWAIR